MKKKILNNILAASLIVGSITATSLAFYLKNADEKNINVTLNSGSTDIQFGISDIAEADNTKKLSPENNSKAYTYTLSATAQNDFHQDVAISTLTVTFKTTNKDLYDNVTVSNVIDYQKTDTSLDDRSTYYSKETNLNTMTFGEKATEQGSDGYYSLVGTMDAPISVLYGNSVNLTLTLGNVTDDLFLSSIAEATYSIDVVVSENTTFNYAYVGGVDSLGWEPVDATMMVPNIYADTWEWMWKADKDYKDSAIKAYKVESGNTTYSANYGTEEGGDNDGNYKCSIVTGDSIYWNGESDTKASFYHPTTNA